MAVFMKSLTKPTLIETDIGTLRLCLKLQYSFKPSTLFRGLKRASTDFLAGQKWGSVHV